MAPTTPPTVFPCGPRQYLNETAAPAKCVDFRKCIVNVSFETVHPTATSDRACADVTECAGGEFIYESATLTSNAVCATCTTVCPAGQIVGEPCGVDHDARCKTTPSSATTNSNGDMMIIMGVGTLVLAAAAAIAVTIVHRLRRPNRGGAYHMLEMSAIPGPSTFSPYPHHYESAAVDAAHYESDAVEAASMGPSDGRHSSPLETDVRNGQSTRLYD